MNKEMQIKRRTHRTAAVLNRIADRVDLAIDVMTLGQYGLERVPSPQRCELDDGHEPLPRSGRRRGGCAPAVTINWDWPVAHGDAATR